MASKKTRKTAETALQSEEQSFSEMGTVKEASENEKLLKTKENDPSNDDRSALQADKRIFVYIGPSIRGVETNGSIFFNTKEGILSEIKVRAKSAGAEVLVKYIERLVFADTDVSTARKRLKEGGNSLSIAYNEIIKWKEHN